MGRGNVMALGGSKESQWKPKTYNPKDNTGGWGSQNGPGGGGGGSSFGTTIPEGTQQYFDKAWDVFDKSWASPGMSPDAILKMQNQADQFATKANANERKQFNNRMNQRGLTGSGFADAQENEMVGRQFGDRMNTLTNIGIENEKLAAGNRVGLTNTAAGLAGQYGQIGASFADIFNRDSANQLDWQKFFYQQDEDRKDRNTYEDQKSEQDYWLAEFMKKMNT